MAETLSSHTPPPHGPRMNPGQEKSAEVESGRTCMMSFFSLSRMRMSVFSGGDLG